MDSGTFFLQFVDHGDMVESDDGQHAVVILSRKALLQRAADVAGDQLLRQGLVARDQHDDDQQPVPHGQATAA